MEHVHCNNCIQINCKDAFCAITTCKAGCGSVLHMCKAEDHNIVCKNAVMACINVCYGCDVKLPRYQLAKHLTVCPASVVVCSYEWRRWGTEKTYMHSLKPVPRNFDKEYADQLDIALTTRDQRKLIRELNDLNTTYSVNPFKLSIQTSTSSMRKTQCFTTLEDLRFKISTFCCDTILRRDEYSSHYQNIHNDIPELLPQLEQRCPLFDLGCMFTQTSLCPSKPGWQVMIAKTFGAVCVKPLPVQSLDVNKSPNTSLTTMPQEVVEHILRFLDTLSLLHLLQVNRRIHEIVWARVAQRGVVLPIWKKKTTTDENGLSKCEWSIVDMEWRFSTAMGTISKWVIKDTKCHLSDHLKICPYFERVNNSVPYFAFWPNHPEVQENERIRARLQGHVDNQSSQSTAEPDQPVDLASKE